MQPLVHAQSRRPLKLLLIAGNINEGLAWQRLHLPLMHLFEKGLIDVRCRSYDEVSHTDFFYCDAVVMAHCWAPIALHIVERARFHYRRPVICDLDDVLHALPVDHPEYTINRVSKSPNIAQAATAMVYSTDTLAQIYGHLNSNHVVIENCVNPKVYEGYKPHHKPYKQGFIVGWSGGQSHRGDLDVFVEGLTQFMEEFDDVRFHTHVLCPQRLYDRFGCRVIYEPSAVPFLDYPGVSAAYPFHLWCVPLQSNPFNNGKSDMKLLESAPHEIPLLASPRDSFIRHSDKKIMIYAEDYSPYWSWKEALSWAYQNQEELQAMALRAKEYVLTHRTVDVAAKLWGEVLNV